MSLELFWTFVAGGAVSLAGACLGIKQMLSAPDRPNYPSSGPWARFIMFWLSALLIARGVEIVVKALRPEPAVLSGFAVGSALLIFAYFSNRLYAHLTQRASARTQRLISRLHNMARCAPKDSGLVAARKSAMENSTGGKPGPVGAVPEALLGLSLDGVRVAAPNEGPEAFTGPWQ